MSCQTQLLADAASFFYYWPQFLAAWLLWGLLFAAIGSFGAWIRWRKLKRTANAIESEMHRLKLEQSRLRVQIGKPYSRK